MVKFVVIASLVLLATVGLCNASSWDAYIDNLIGQSKNTNGVPQVDKACIIGKDASRWTSNNHAKALKPTNAEVAAISNAFTRNEYTTFMANGIYIEGVKYQFLRGEDNQVTGKKKDYGSIVLIASKTGVVIAHVPEGSQAGNGIKAADVIAEYLRSLGM